MKYRQIRILITEGDADDQIIHLDLDKGMHVDLSWWDGMRLCFLLMKLFVTSADDDIEVVPNSRLQ